MASLIKRPNGHDWVQFTDIDSKRKTLRLGRCSQRKAERTKGVVEDPLSANTLNQDRGDKTEE